MLDIKINKNIDSNRVLIIETNINNKKQPTRYYVVPQENSDGFISGKKSLDNTDKIQKCGAIILGGLVGVATYKGLLHKKTIKTIASIFAGLGAAIGALALNEKIDTQAQKNIFEKTGAYEITNNKEKLAKVLETKTEDSVTSIETENTESSDKTKATSVKQ